MTIEQYIKKRGYVPGRGGWWIPEVDAIPPTSTFSDEYAAKLDKAKPVHFDADKDPLCRAERESDGLKQIDVQGKDRGVAGATYRIPGSRYAQKSDQRWEMKYAQEGNALAMYEVASDYMYWHKRGANGPEAFAWLKKSADAGLARACESVADVYRNGCVELHVLTDRESVEHYPIKASRRLADAYERKAKRIREKMRRPFPRVLSSPEFGWCAFTPANGCFAWASSITGNFPRYVVDVLIARLTRTWPMNITADGEDEVSVFADTISLIDDKQAFFVRKKRDDNGSHASVVEVKFDVIEMAKQVVDDIELDYYGWVKFACSDEYAKEEERIRKKVSELKQAVAFYERTVTDD